MRRAVCQRYLSCLSLSSTMPLDVDHVVNFFGLWSRSAVGRWVWLVATVGVAVSWAVLCDVTDRKLFHSNNTALRWC